MVYALAKPLLVVEDSDEDFETLSWAMKRLSIENEVVRCADGDEVLDYLRHSGSYSDAEETPRPAMILLDLNLPAVDGREVLEQIKRDENLKLIPVVVWTTSSNPKDVELCYKNGANSYIVKPIHLDNLLSAVALLERYWLRVVALPDTSAYS